MMEFKDITDFLRNHTSAEWFEKDLELFKKVLPASKLINSLDNAQGYNKAELDERMCNELMSVGGICDCTILENRGYTKDKDSFIISLISDTELNDFEKHLLALDLDNKPDYNTMKGIIFGLDIKAENAKGSTYIDLLKEKKQQLLEAQQKTNEETKVDKDSEQEETDDSQIDGESDTNTNEDAQPIQLSSRGNVLVDQSPKDYDHAKSADAEKKSEGQEQSTQE